MSDEIVEAMNSINVGNQIDEEDLEEELEQLQQEQLDEQMLGTGTVPVSDAIQRLPAAGNGESKSHPRPRVALRRWRHFADRHAVPVKTGKAPAVVEDDEEAELRKLQAEMAM